VRKKKKTDHKKIHKNPNCNFKNKKTTRRKQNPLFADEFLKKEYIYI